MAKLKSLFGANVKTTPEEGATKEMSSRNRTPSVVARLMGLEALPAEPATTGKKEKAVVLLEKRVPDSNTLVDITVSGKRLNGGVTRSQKSRSFDEAFDDRHKDVREVRAVLQGAECLQSIQLDELNRQLLAKHMRVLDELKEAKQQMAQGKAGVERQQQQPRKGLSDSSEFLDAVELLQANRQFFEKYFRSSGALEAISQRNDSASSTRESKRENKLPTGRIPRFLSGQSSPRPLMKEQSKVLNGDSGRLLTSRDEKHEVSSIVVLKPRKRTDQRDRESKQEDQRERESKQEKQTVKDRKDIAKLIAKKIKESISKEVAKTFYSKVESGSPQRSPSRSFDKSDDTPRSRHSRSLSQPESEFSGDLDASARKNVTRVTDLDKRKPESVSPRSKRLSRNSGSRDDTNSTKNASAKAQKPVTERKSKSSSPRNTARHRELNSLDASPRNPSPRSTVSLDESPRPPRQKSNNAVKPPKPHDSREIANGKCDRATAERKSKLKSSKPKPDGGDDTKNLADVWLEPQKGHCHLVKHQLVAEIADEDCITITPTKNEPDSSSVTSKHGLKSFADSTSPVSVLDLLDEDEHDHDVAHQEDRSMSKPATSSQTSQALQRIVQAEPQHEECKPPPSQELSCSPGRQHDLIYVRKLAAAATASSRIQELGTKLDSTVFEKLEDEYSRDQSSQDSAIDAMKIHSRAINRWLIFDFANEILSAQPMIPKLSDSGRRREEKLLHEVWSSMSEHHSLQRSGEQSLESMINGELQKERRKDWVEAESGFANVCQQIENSFFNELIEDAIADLV
ncbi:hypothetical protein SELMODRAFT_430564 [Selaginella moellendorffii]|uniref:DUF4378 domain-containing protein n=1 Tax=Selaginella moellendorffii TaxID=88036 RepID=D8T9T1_SELML|nr:DNA ligase 1 [Selaginella moellendorffii]XP_024521766.1 DNA ligase 1 [Selaginella moellendorffii]EFJ06609.1 hypothetical protein SELMODRAFT_430564 [Selaginella moellendorffii]|eukprot:XP_002992333.1 DNA ligase 1 [Selaginella moellendorffii]